MDPGDVLPPSPPKRVPAVAVRREGRALDGLETHDFRAEARLQRVAGRDRAGRSHGRDESRRPAGGQAPHRRRRRRARARDLVVPAVIRHLGELVHDAGLRVRREAPALVVDLLDVRLAARRLDDRGTVGLDLLEPLGAHLLGQDDDGLVPHARPDPGAADAVVAGRRPHECGLAGEDVARELPFHQDRIGRADLVRAGREILRVKEHDRRGDSGQRFRQQERADAPCLVPPRDVEEVDRIERCLALRGAGARAELRREKRRVAHLLVRRAVNHAASSALRTASSEGAIREGGATDSMAPRMSFKPLPVATWRTLSLRATRPREIAVSRTASAATPAGSAKTPVARARRGIHERIASSDAVTIAPPEARTARSALTPFRGAPTLIESATVRAATGSILSPPRSKAFASGADASG